MCRVSIDGQIVMFTSMRNDQNVQICLLFDTQIAKILRRRMKSAHGLDSTALELNKCFLTCQGLERAFGGSTAENLHPLVFSAGQFPVHQTESICQLSGHDGLTTAGITVDHGKWKIEGLTYLTQLFCVEYSFYPRHVFSSKSQISST